MPDATPLTINLMGAIAQYERETVSKRTKRALAELKNRGVELGANNPKVKAGLEKYRERQKKEQNNKLKPQKIKESSQLSNPSKVEQADQRHIQALQILRRNKHSWKRLPTSLTCTDFKHVLEANGIERQLRGLQIV